MAAASQAGPLVPNEVAASRDAAQQAGPHAPAAAAHGAMQPAAPLGSRSASSASLSDSLPDHSIVDLLRRPASAPAAAAQTQHTRRHAAVQSAAAAALQLQAQPQLQTPAACQADSSTQYAITPAQSLVQHHATAQASWLMQGEATQVMPEIACNDFSQL